MKTFLGEKRSLGYLKVAMLIGVVLYFLSCNGTPTEPNDNQAFRIAATCIVDQSVGRSIVLSDLTKGLARRPAASIQFGADSLRFNRPGFTPDSLFSVQFGTSSRYSLGTNRLFVNDSALLGDTFPITVTGTFSITQIFPTNRDAHGSLQVSLAWSASDSARGYAMAAVLKKDAYVKTGYSTFVTSFNTIGTFPPEAFSLSPGPLPDTGWYYVYVYAYSGVPDSNLTAGLLPVPFPHQLTDNLTGRQDINGRYGMIRVAARDSVHVRY